MTLRHTDSCKEFKGKIPLFIKIKSNSSVHKVYGIQRLSRLRLNFSHLNEQNVVRFLKMKTALCAIVV